MSEFFSKILCNLLPYYKDQRKRICEKLTEGFNLVYNSYFLSNELLFFFHSNMGA